MMITQKQVRNYMRALILQKKKQIRELKKEIRILRAELYLAGIPDNVIEEIIKDAQKKEA